MIIAHIDVVCEDSLGTSDETKSQIYLKYFYDQELSTADKLAILIKYFEKCRLGLVKFNCNDLNYFLEKFSQEKPKEMDDFYNILCGNVLEHLTFENVEKLRVVFWKILEGVKGESNRRYRGLKSMLVAEAIKKMNLYNRVMLTEFINSV